MNFLPIVERELRVAARERKTYWVRVLVPAGTVGLLCYFFSGYLRWHNLSDLGRELLHFLACTTLLVGMLAGVVVTGDALSREKRDGTLGLLFLTHLTGWDVVLGKLTAASTRVFFGVLALVPLLMFSLLLGGTTPAEVGRIALALLNAVLFSLAAGMFASASVERAGRGQGLAIGFVLFVVAVLPLTGILLEYENPRYFTRWFYLPSPVCAYHLTRPGRMYDVEFWRSLGVSFGVSLCLLFGAGLMAARSWKQGAESSRTRSWQAWRRWWSLGGARTRAEKRARFMDRSPALWLVCRERPLGLWAMLVLLPAGLFGGICWWAKADTWTHDAVFDVVGITAYVFNIVCKVAVASEASHMYPEARRTGWLEMLAGTGLTAREIVIRGAWQGILRRVAPPLVVLLIIEWATLWHFLPRYQRDYAVELIVACTVVFVADIVAMIWVGLWLGMRYPSGTRVTMSCVWRVLLLPWVFLFVLEMGSVFRGGGEVAVTFYVVISFGTSALVTALAANRLLIEFRLLACQTQLRKFGEIEREMQVIYQARSRYEATPQTGSLTPPPVEINTASSAEKS